MQVLNGRFKSWLDWLFSHNGYLVYSTNLLTITQYSAYGYEPMISTTLLPYYVDYVSVSTLWRPSVSPLGRRRFLDQQQRPTRCKHIWNTVSRQEFPMGIYVRSRWWHLLQNPTTGWNRCAHGNINIRPYAKHRSCPPTITVWLSRVSTWRDIYGGGTYNFEAVAFDTEIDNLFR